MKKSKQLCLIVLLIGYLGVHNGYLALWKNGCAEPDRIFPRQVCLYPETDQNALKKGIPFSTQKELHRLMEDFLS